jgi:hypothetical protein
MLIGTAVLGASALALAGCSSLDDTTNTSDAKPVNATTSASASAGSGGGQSGCDTALHDISTYGPSTLKLLADGHEAAGKARVQLLVDGLDAAADAANSPKAKQGIQNLANAYDDYFQLRTDVETIPLTVLLKDTADLKFVCG